MVATTKEQNLPKNSSGPDKGYPNLFSPAKIGRMRLKNKIIRAANTTLYASPKDGTVTQLLLDHYAVEAAGGVGLCLVEASSTNVMENQILTQILPSVGFGIYPKLLK